MVGTGEAGSSPTGKSWQKASPKARPGRPPPHPEPILAPWRTPCIPLPRSRAAKETP